MRPERLAAFRGRVAEFARCGLREFPWREERDPYKILVAEILLQRSRASTVTPVYEAFLRRWPTPQALARAQVRTIASVILPLGLVSRAARLRELGRTLGEMGNVPSSPDELAALPGVGRYVANATAAAAFGRRLPTVDGVSARVYRRYFGLPANRPPVDDDELWRLVERVLPRRDVRSWNWAVLDLAATICRPARPRCHECPLRPGCRWARERVSADRATLRGSHG